MRSLFLLSSRVRYGTTSLTVVGQAGPAPAAEGGPSGIDEDNTLTADTFQGASPDDSDADGGVSDGGGANGPSNTTPVVNDVFSLDYTPTSDLRGLDYSPSLLTGTGGRIHLPDAAGRFLSVAELGYATLGFSSAVNAVMAVNSGSDRGPTAVEPAAFPPIAVLPTQATNSHVASLYNRSEIVTGELNSFTLAAVHTAVESADVSDNLYLILRERKFVELSDDLRTAIIDENVK